MGISEFQQIGEPFFLFLSLGWRFVCVRAHNLGVFFLQDVSRHIIYGRVMIAGTKDMAILGTELMDR